MQKINKIMLAGICVAMIGACSKRVAEYTGTIHGKPATTLYGNTNKYADYVLLSTDSAQIAYSGNIYKYVFFAGSSTHVFLRDTISPVGSGQLIISGNNISLSFDTIYAPFIFGSRYYSK